VTRTRKTCSNDSCVHFVSNSFGSLDCCYGGMDRVTCVLFVFVDNCFLCTTRYLILQFRCLFSSYVKASRQNSLLLKRPKRTNSFGAIYSSYRVSSYIYRDRQQSNVINQFAFTFWWYEPFLTVSIDHCHILQDKLSIQRQRCETDHLAQ